MQMGEEGTEKRSWFLPHGQSNIHVQDARGARWLAMACTEREDLASSPHSPCLLTINISHSWQWHGLSDGFR